MLDAFKKVKRSGNFRRTIKKRTKELLCLGDTQKKVEDICDHLPTTINDDEHAVEPPINWVNCDSDEEECDNVESKITYTDLYDKKATFLEGLSNWAIRCQVNRHQVRDLLIFCNEAQVLPFDLPVDPRTIFHTPKSIVIKDFSDEGLYWHRGLKECLQLKLENVQFVPQQISLNINIDGLPICESSNKQFWPILFNIHELHFIEPGVIGIFCGAGKRIYTKKK